MLKRILTVASVILDVPLDSLNERSSAENLSEWESLKQLNLALALEEEFNVILSDEEIVEMQSIGKIYEILQNHVGKVSCG